MNAESIMTLAVERRDLYATWQLFWFSIHYAAGFLAIVAGALAAAGASQKGPKFIQNHLWAWGVSASILSGAVTFLEPMQKARVYKRAYYDLAEAIAAKNDGLLDLPGLRAVLVSSQNRVVNGQSSAKEEKSNCAEKSLDSKTP